MYMDVHQTSISSIPNLIGTSDLSVKEKSYAQLESVDYNRLCLEQAQLQSQNQHQDQAYIHSGQLVSMSGVIENGQFIPIQLNTMPRSISNNSIKHFEPLYQQTNENQQYSPSIIAYHRSSPPVYYQSTNVQASPSILTSNTISLEQERIKRGHHDVNSSIDNEDGWQTARSYKKVNRSTFKSNISNAANQPTTVSVNIRPQIFRNQTSYVDPLNAMADSNSQVTSQAQRYATTRYPFSPFVIHFKDNVRDKLVVEHLVNHSKQQFKFGLQVIGYRRSQVNCSHGEYDVLVFVETTDSFEFLFEDAHWPSQLVGKDFTLKKPSIPPQLSLVIQNVSFDIDWEDFIADLQAKYPDIVKTIRLKNRNLQDLKSIKIEIKSVKIRNEILEHKFISISNMRYKVVEYLALANVLICSRCRCIGHFQKNCPQQDQVTCNTCGEKYANVKDHTCSGELKCIHCGGAHRSNDSKCRIIKDYRAALTRTLLSKPPVTVTDKYPDLTSHSSGQSHLTNSSVSNSSDMDKIFKKMEEEGEKTRSTIESFKTEMLEHDVENKRRIDLLNEQLEINEQKVRDLQAKIKMLEEKFEIEQQKVQYVQNKAEGTESMFSSYQQDANILLKNITRVFAIMRESKILPVPDDYLSLFNEKTNRLDKLLGSSSKQPIDKLLNQK